MVKFIKGPEDLLAETNHKTKPTRRRATFEAPNSDLSTLGTIVAQTGFTQFAIMEQALRLVLIMAGQRTSIAVDETLLAAIKGLANEK